MRNEVRKGRRTAQLCAAFALLVAPLTLQAEAAVADYSSSSTIGATVESSFMFSVSGLNSGACNGATITGSGSSGSAVSLGRVDRTSAAIGAQNLTVASNAGNGYSVFAQVDGPLTDGAGHSIATVSNSPDSPGSFPSPGSEGFGYTTNSSLQGAAPNRFFAGGTKWAGIDTNQRQVMFGPGATTEATNCVAYQITISPNTVGGAYGNNVTYTAVPSF